MFDDKVLHEIAVQAKTHGLDLAALLAVVEIESGGKAIEPADGVTPTFLFERHVFHRQIMALSPDKLQVAINQGLAIPKWSPSAQYRDEGKSAGRLALLAQARAINEEAANRSCSWGVGQTMGFLFHDLGFVSATEMVAFQTRGGVPAQVDCMIREIKRQRLDIHLNNHNWASFARGYNGVGYAKNHYDTKLRSAYLRWLPKATQIAAAAAVVSPSPPPAAEQPPPKPASLPAPKPAEQGLWGHTLESLTALFGRSHDA